MLRRFGKFRPRYLEALIAGRRFGKFRGAGHGREGKG